MEVELIRQYTLIVDFLGHVLGPDYEIALHELRTTPTGSSPSPTES